MRNKLPMILPEMNSSLLSRLLLVMIPMLAMIPAKPSSKKNSTSGKEESTRPARLTQRVLLAEKLMKSSQTKRKPEPVVEMVPKTTTQE